MAITLAQTFFSNKN